jgi:hypothetical protein
MSTCRSCGAPVIWLRMRPSGKRMPVDAKAAPDGNVFADLDAGIGVVLTGSLDMLTPDEPLYRSHFATCPHAGDWRRRAAP